MYFARLRGNNKNLSVFELKQFTDVQENIDNKYVLFNKEFDFSRLAYTNFVCELIAKGNTISEVIERSKEYFKDKCFEDFRISGCKEYFDVLGELVNGKVNLRYPKYIFYVTETKPILFGKIIWKINPKEYERRFARSFYRASNLKPDLARFLVDLSLVKPGETLIDPFCGTGSILIEAASLGVKSYGIEIDEEIYEGCLDNLFVLGYDDLCEVYNADALNFNYKTYDVLVTDLPYGKCSSLKGRKRDDFIEKLPDIFKHIRKRKVVMYNQDISDIWDLIDMEKYKVHGKLTRYIHVFK